MTDDQYRYHVQAKLTRARMGSVHGPTPREITDWVREAQHDLLHAPNVADNQNPPDEIFTLRYEYHMELGRARYLNGERVKDVRNEFIRAASQVETLFREMYASPGGTAVSNAYAPDQHTIEVQALEGVVATLMASDFDAARRITNAIQNISQDLDTGEPLLSERRNFLQALMLYLNGQTFDTQESLRPSSRAYCNRCLSGMDARTYYFTLHTALRGIVERDANLLNTGLTAHLEFYAWMLRNNGSEIDRPAHFICDTALALANLGLAGRVKVWTRHALLPASLLGQSSFVYH